MCQVLTNMGSSINEYLTTFGIVTNKALTGNILITIRLINPRLKYNKVQYNILLKNLQTK